MRVSTASVQHDAATHEDQVEVTLTYLCSTCHAISPGPEQGKTWKCGVSSLRSQRRMSLPPSSPLPYQRFVLTFDMSLQECHENAIGDNAPAVTSLTKTGDPRAPIRSYPLDSQQVEWPVPEYLRVEEGDSALLSVGRIASTQEG
jgi:hypothetical protein